MERDQFRCWECSADNKPLNVHHQRYEHGKMPWEYSGDTLITLCEDCHKTISELVKAIKLETSNLCVRRLQLVYGFILGMKVRTEAPMLSDFDTAGLPVLRGVICGSGTPELNTFIKSEIRQHSDKSAWMYANALQERD